jgi:hypothetical protein
MRGMTIEIETEIKIRKCTNQILRIHKSFNKERSLNPEKQSTALQRCTDSAG